MGDPTVEVLEENRDASQMAKGQAMEAISEGNVVFFSGIICFFFTLYLWLMIVRLCFIR